MIGAGGEQAQALTAADAAWLRMDRPENLMVITGLIELDGRLSLEALEALARARLLSHPRFSQRVSWRLGRPRWAPDPRFELGAHLHRVGLPPPGDRAALAELIGDLASTPLDHARPLWQAHLIEHASGGGSALVVRLHHAIGDGMALVRLLLSLTDHDGAAAAAEVGAAPAAASGARARLRRLAQGASTLARDLMLPADADTMLRGALGTRKGVAWSAPAPLAAITRAAHAAGCTVNDVMTAAIAGALRSYLERHDDARAHAEVRAMVPVNLRRVVGDGGGDGHDRAGNRFGLVYLPLPLAAATPAERLAEVHRRMRAIKQSPEALLGFGVVGAMGLAHVAVERFGIELFTRKASVLITSVPGPSRPVRLAGVPVANLLYWAPTSGGLGVGLSLISYAGSARLGVGADRRLVADPQALADAYDREIAALTA